MERVNWIIYKEFPHSQIINMEGAYKCLFTPWIKFGIHFNDFYDTRQNKKKIYIYILVGQISCKII